MSAKSPALSQRTREGQGILFVVQLGVSQEDNRFLVIERNDGRGVSFPGGLDWPWETAEETLVREIREEAGLTVTNSLLMFRYATPVGIPVGLAVCEVEADGQLRG